MAPVECDLVEDLVLAKLSVVRDVIENHKHGARVVVLAHWVLGDDLLLDVVDLVDLGCVVHGGYVADGDVLGELFDDVLGGRLDKARVEATPVLVHDVFNKNGFALAGTAKDVPGVAEGHLGKVVGANVNDWILRGVQGAFLHLGPGFGAL